MWSMMRSPATPSLARPSLMVLSTLLVALGSSGTVLPVAAQDTRVEVLAYGASFGAMPSDYLAPVLTNPDQVLALSDVPRALSIGLGLEVRAQALPVGLRLHVQQTVQDPSRSFWTCLPSAGGCPAVLVEVPLDMVTRVAAASAFIDVPVGLVTVQPMVGVGAVRAGFEWDPTQQGSISLDPGSFVETTAALFTGLGVAVGSGPTRLRLEYGQYWSGERDGGSPSPTSLGLGISIGL